MLSYPAAIPLSNRTLARLAELIRVRRADRRSRWRRLQPGQQALLVLAHLRNEDTYARLPRASSVCKYSAALTSHAGGHRHPAFVGGRLIPVEDRL
ncbi:hypothetical protein GCM10009530_77540 [Microbispora corallina]|uniref:Transposase n=1 Tax=Microbispora corallina TaxID=83302 RepID=A0ABQ4GCA8_9ACTN|nr:hypothetical protein Mco01_76280 [Microbispora corallina]